MEGDLLPKPMGVAGGNREMIPGGVVLMKVHKSRDRQGRKPEHRGHPFACDPPEPTEASDSGKPPGRLEVSESFVGSAPFDLSESLVRAESLVVSESIEPTASKVGRLVDERYKILES